MASRGWATVCARHIGIPLQKHSTVLFRCVNGRIGVRSRLVAHAAPHAVV
jgi:hypothetical protein